MSLPLVPQEGQEDGAAAAGVGGGGHGGADRAARPPTGPQPAPAGLLLQVHHLSPAPAAQRPIRLQGLLIGPRRRTNGRASCCGAGLVAAVTDVPEQQQW